MPMDKKDHERLRRYRAEKPLGDLDKRITRKVHVDCSFKPEYSERLSELLEEKGYRYGVNGRSYERRAYHNMPYITIDVTNGFYLGSKGADVAVDWLKAWDGLFDKIEEKLPDISEVHTAAAKNSQKPRDTHMRQPSKDGRKMERFWITGTGRPMPISAMKDDHLHNTILMVDRTIADGCDSIGGNEDLANLLDELEDERIHRGLHLPLIPLISLEYRKGTHHDKY